MPDETRRLFFALRPDSRAGGEIERAAALLNAGGRVRGRWLKPSKYHMTVQFLGNHPGRPAGIIERACMAAAQLRIAPFEVVLDRVATFDGHRKSPCVLRCTPDSEGAVEALRAALGEALARHDLADLLESRFTPHLTIAYIDGSLAQPVAVQSIVWPVREFALVESHVRESRHEVLAQWQLTQ